jgi:hypothetical protein
LRSATAFVRDARNWASRSGLKLFTLRDIPFMSVAGHPCRVNPVPFMLRNDNDVLA